MAEHVVFEDLLVFGWEGLVTNRTIQTKGLQVLLLGGGIENVIGEVGFAGGALPDGELVGGEGKSKGVSPEASSA